jgi:hypothetical protein
MSKPDLMEISMAVFLSRVARSTAREGQAGEPLSIGHRGKVIRQLVLMPDGKVEEEAIV